MEREIRVAYVDHCARLSGGEIALVRLLADLRGVRCHVVLGEDGPLVPRITAAGASVEILPLDVELANTSRHDVRPGRLGISRLALSIKAVLALRSRLLQLRPDVVHTNSLKAAIYGGIAGRLAGLPVVWHVRDRIAEDYLPGGAVRTIRWMAKVLPTAVICNSVATSDALGLRGGSAGTRCWVIHDGVAPREPARDGDRSRDSSAPLTVAIVGRLAPWKGQDVFLDAFAQAFPDTGARALVVGSAMFGEEDFADQLGRQVASLGLDSRVEFTGFVDDVEAVLAGVDVLVHASVIPEPFGQVVVEGMAMGLPVIAAAAGGPREVITDEVDGLLSPVGDVDALAHRLRRLHDDADLRQRLGAAGRRRARDFTPERVAAKVREVYVSLM